MVVGDGGFQMTQCELATLQQEQLDIKIAIINNGYLGMVRQWQEFFHDKRYAATPMLSPDFVEAGRGVRHRRRTASARAATSCPRSSARAPPVARC